MFPLNREFLSLAILFLIALVISTFIPNLLGADSGRLELYFPTTAIVISPLALSPLIFVPLVYFVYLIKEWHYRYQRGRQRMTLIIFNSILLISLAYALIFSTLLNIVVQSILNSNPGMEIPGIILQVVDHFPRLLLSVLFCICSLTAISVGFMTLRKR